MQRRRTVRTFSSEPLPDGVLENIVQTAGTAPSGANKQPWFFTVVTSPEIKRRIRVAAEHEEALKLQQPLQRGDAGGYWWVAGGCIQTVSGGGSGVDCGVQAELCVLTRRVIGARIYYVNESVGIASGLLLAAIHQAGVGLR